MKLELRLVVSCHVGARTQTLVLWRNKPVLLLLAISPASVFLRCDGFHVAEDLDDPPAFIFLVLRIQVCTLRSLCGAEDETQLFIHAWQVTELNRSTQEAEVGFLSFRPDLSA